MIMNNYHLTRQEQIALEREYLFKREIWCNGILEHIYQIVRWLETTEWSFFFWLIICPVLLIISFPFLFMLEGIQASQAALDINEKE